MLLNFVDSRSGALHTMGKFDIFYYVYSIRYRNLIDLVKFKIITTFMVRVFQQVHPAAPYRKGCYAEDGDVRHFTMSPGNYLTSALTQQICFDLCELWSMQYAGKTATTTPSMIA